MELQTKIRINCSKYLENCKTYLRLAQVVSVSAFTFVRSYATALVEPSNWSIPRRVKVPHSSFTFLHKGRALKGKII